MIFVVAFLIIFFIYYRIERRERRALIMRKQKQPKWPTNTQHPSGSSDHTSNFSSRSRQMRTRAIRTHFGDGIFEVGVDISPGTYRSLGRSPLETKWRRLSDFSGNGVVASDAVVGPCIVTIAETDQGFESVNSGGWQKVSRENKAGT